MSDIRLTQEVLAKRWDVSTATLERWRTEGVGPRYLKLQGTVRYRVEDIEAFEHNAARQSTAPAVAGVMA